MAAKLYQFLGSPFCAKVRKLLAFKGVEFEVVEVDYLERKELVLASGQMMVPALTLESGRRSSIRRGSRRASRNFSPSRVFFRRDGAAFTWRWPTISIISSKTPFMASRSRTSSRITRAKVWIARRYGV